jgi:AcrR family transcriptional regulator
MTTKERILDTAEICFAQRGFDGTSLREITALAEVNLGAVNYHFGSKAGLFEEVLRRRFEPLNQRRIEMLDAAIARHAPGDPPLEEIMEAFLRAPVEAFGTPARATLLAVLHSVHEGQLSPEHFERLFSKLQRHYAKIRDYLEPMSDAEFQGRLRFVIGGMIHLLADRMWTGSNLDAEAILNMLIHWGVSVLRAPVTCPPELATEQVR